MDALTLARLQFGITTIYHFFFVPLTMGLAILVAVMHTQYYRTNDEKYKRMTKFWGKLFLINFAMGVVTGIVQEFQFGMNWSEYSRFVGDIFGAPLAIEALVAFFIESTFLGIWIFGWGRIRKGLHLASIWMVALGANLSALWILIANSFMQNPVGYEIVDGRAQMVDFGAVLTNPNIFVQFPHVFFSALTTGAFFVVGVSAWQLIRNRHEDDRFIFNASMRIGLIAGTVAVIGTMGAGHASGQHMADYQPMKLAAAEGLWESEDPAALSFFQIGNEAERESVFNIQIPSLLSFMTYNTVDGLVQGINPLNARYQEQFADMYGADADYVPPAIWLTYWSFRAMVGAGGLMLLAGALGLWLNFRKSLERSNRILWLLVFVMALPYLANATGWILTEMGRQPWIVFGLMRIEDAVSPGVGVAELTITLVGFTLVYGGLMAVDIYLLQKYARQNADGELMPWFNDGIQPSMSNPAAEGSF